ncbi:hypothetical protein HID58_069177 [Brassica napus]|uniref:Metallothionein-like protein n=1 Tax=Brassica napus TaxID=3708 RepID=A0ABQ7XEZ3_BRANA|nr:hypothetical protein HID58_069177 [Brassica napus]
MSSCGNCDCADKNQCEEGNQLHFDIVETQESYKEAMIMDVNGAEKNGCQCKCGSSCSCVNCTCCPN